MVYLGIETVFSSVATDGKDRHGLWKCLLFQVLMLWLWKSPKNYYGRCLPVKFVWCLLQNFTGSFCLPTEKALSIIHSAQNWSKKAISVRGIASSLRASSPGHFGGAAGEGRRACNYVSEIWIPLPIPWWLLVDWAVRFQPISKKSVKNTCQG